MACCWEWMAISSILDGSENLTGVVKSLAAGTFIFVPAMELIPIELDSTAGKKWIKLLLLILGYCGMSILALWVWQIQKSIMSVEMIDIEKQFLIITSREKHRHSIFCKNSLDEKANRIIKQNRPLIFWRIKIVHQSHLSANPPCLWWQYKKRICVSSSSEASLKYQAHVGWQQATSGRSLSHFGCLIKLSYVTEHGDGFDYKYELKDLKSFLLGKRP